MALQGEYSFRLQKGIAGGFAPPTPDAIHTFLRLPDSPFLTIQSAIRPDGTPELQQLEPKKIDSSSEHTFAKVQELYDILKQIPTEYPPGSEDIYGLDTSIAWMSDGFEWCNGGPQGCGGGTSKVQASTGDKAKFKKAVDIVNELVAKDA